MESDEIPITRDRYNLNVVAESFSRALTFISGLLSTTLLYRSVAGGSWTLDDYGAFKVLTNVNQLLLPIILLGLNGATLKIVAEFSSDRKKLGQTIGNSILIITIAFFVVAFVSVFFDMGVFLLASKAPTLDVGALRLYWVMVILSLLPTAYLRIVKTSFSGIQRMKKTLVVDIVYNLFWILSLLYLFLTSLVNIYNILLLNIIQIVIGTSMGIGLLIRECRLNDIKISFKPDGEILSKLRLLAAVFFISALVTASLNNLTVVWMSLFGTLGDVGLFSIAQGITVTVRMVIGAPLVVLGPNLTADYARGKIDEVYRKFREASHMLVPTYAFAFASIFAFATPALRVIYGADGVAATGYLQLLSFNVIFVVIPGIYTYLYLAADDAKGLFLSAIIQVVIQNLWIILLTPIIGINAIAVIWIVYIPFLIAQDYYSKQKHNIGMDGFHVTKSLVLGFAFAAGMYFFVDFLQYLMKSISLPGILEAAIIALFVVPIWYFYIAVGTAFKLVNKADLDNIQAELKKYQSDEFVSDISKFSELKQLNRSKES